ncbi:MAG TPA: winged helix-turn-helix transcriptional regulator [Candidatus Paceibacterota bacterium]
MTNEPENQNSDQNPITVIPEVPAETQVDSTSSPQVDSTSLPQVDSINSPQASSETVDVPVDAINENIPPETTEVVSGGDATAPAETTAPENTEEKSEDLLLSSPLPKETPPVLNQTAQFPPIEPFTRNPVRELLTKAGNVIRARKRKKIEKIMELFAKRTRITNDEVEKLLHVSDATATRYLSMLESEGRIRQVGIKGKAVFYEKI